MIPVRKAHADADFEGPFGDRDEHDVHHAYAPHNQRDHGNRRQQIGERVLRFIGRLDCIGPVPDVGCALVIVGSIVVVSCFLFS
jgi:hypothetical protein